MIAGFDVILLTKGLSTWFVHVFFEFAIVNDFFLLSRLESFHLVSFSPSFLGALFYWWVFININFSLVWKNFSSSSILHILPYWIFFDPIQECNIRSSMWLFTVMWHVDTREIRLILIILLFGFWRPFFKLTIYFEFFEKKNFCIIFWRTKILFGISHEVWRARKGMESFNVKACLLPI